MKELPWDTNLPSIVLKINEIVEKMGELEVKIMVLQGKNAVDVKE